MVTAPNVTEMRENIEIKKTFTKKKENVWTYQKYWNNFYKKTQTLFLIYTNVPVLENGENVDIRYVLTKKLKIIVLPCFILLNPT